MTGKVREPRREDIPFLLEIYNYEVLNGVATFDTEPKSEAEWEQWYESHVRENALLVWEEDGVPAGYATLSPYRPRGAFRVSAELSVYVRPDRRGRGIGSALMEAILVRAREKEGLHTVISVITGENTGSIRLHERFGFSECGRMREVGYKFGRYLDIVNMQKIVGEK